MMSIESLLAAAGSPDACPRPAPLRVLLAAMVAFGWGVTAVQAQLCPDPEFPFSCNGRCWSCPPGTTLCCPQVGDPSECCFVPDGPSCDAANGTCSVCADSAFPFLCNGQCWSCSSGATLCCPAAGDPSECCSVPDGPFCDQATGGCTVCEGSVFPFTCNEQCWSCPPGTTLCCPQVGDPGECCPEGSACEPVPGTCTGGGIPLTCGNGVRDIGEECDPPQDVACPGLCRPDCTCPSCGNGVVDPGEECDDGANNGTDKPCTDTCANAICGDGKHCADANCTSGPAGGPEECDDGNTINLDACGNDCAAPTVTLNHFKCYTGKFPPFAKRQVTLVDQFHTESTTVLKPQLFCNPVSKNGEPLVSPATHLKCYRIKPQKFERSVVVFNQFGQENVTVKNPNLLCLPSEKEEPPPALPALPPNRDADGDGLIDGIESLLGSSPASAESTPESVAVPRSCLDGLDNDGDGVSDLDDPGCDVAAASEETFPPLGLDAFDSALELDDFPVGPCLVDFEGTGPTVVQRSDPTDVGGGKREIEVEIVAMQLTGTATLSGPGCSLPQGPVPVTIIETPGSTQRSTGKVTDTNPDPGRDFPAESFFDVRFEAITPIGTVAGTTRVENPKVTTIPPYQTEENPRCYRVQGLPHKHCPKPPPREHYKCYKGKFPKFAKREVALIDQFHTETTTVLRPALFCNPVSKNGEPILNAGGHLECYRIKPQPLGRSVVVRNQFGREDVEVKKPSLLCVPSAKQG